MEFDKALKRYKRFMKDHGLYSRMMQLHTSYLRYSDEKKSCKWKKKDKTFIELLKSTSDQPCTWIRNHTIFCTWSRTIEGLAFWWAVSMLWDIICFNEKIHLTNKHGRSSSKGDILMSSNFFYAYVGKNEAPIYKELKTEIERLKEK